MKAVIKVEGVKATFDGDQWASSDESVAAFLNGFRWLGSHHSNFGYYGSHVIALAEEVGATVMSIDDAPTDKPDVVEGPAKKFEDVLNWK